MGGIYVVEVEVTLTLGVAGSDDYDEALVVARAAITEAIENYVIQSGYDSQLQLSLLDIED